VTIKEGIKVARKLISLLTLMILSRQEERYCRFGIWPFICNEITAKNVPVEEL